MRGYGLCLWHTVLRSIFAFASRYILIHCTIYNTNSSFFFHHDINITTTTKWKKRREKYKYWGRKGICIDILLWNEYVRSAVLRCRAQNPNFLSDDKRCVCEWKSELCSNISSSIFLLYPNGTELTKFMGNATALHRLVVPARLCDWRMQSNPFLPIFTSLSFSGRTTKIPIDIRIVSLAYIRFFLGINFAFLLPQIFEILKWQNIRIFMLLAVGCLLLPWPRRYRRWCHSVDVCMRIDNLPLLCSPNNLP